MFSQVSAGGYHNCGLRENGTVECWGYTFDGQAQPPTGKQIAVSAGYDYACALSEAGTITCWMIYGGAADMPSWLRAPAVAMPTTGTGGLLDKPTVAPILVATAIGGAGAWALLILLLRRWAQVRRRRGAV